MSLIKMTSFMLIDQPSLNRWDKGSIRPGPVGSVGDALTAIRIKQTDPDMPVKFDETYSGTNAQKRGSNVQDGSFASFSTGGYNGEVITRKRQKKYSVGTFIQQLSSNDRSFDSVVAPQPRVGTVTQAEAILRRAGDQFQILPGGYGPEPGQLLRGGQVPRVVYGENASETREANTRGVNSGGQSSVVLPSYAEPLMDSVVGPSDPIPWVANRPPRPKLNIDTRVWGAGPYNPASILQGYGSANDAFPKTKSNAGNGKNKSAMAALASGSFLKLGSPYSSSSGSHFNTVQYPDLHAPFF